MFVATVAISVLALTGCSGSRDDAPDAGEDVLSFAVQVSNAIDEASAGGAGDAQLAILHDAQEAGTLTYDQERTAMFAHLDCLTAGGATAAFVEQTEPSGLLVPNVVVEAKDDASLEKIEPLIDECADRESFWVNKLYQLQPESQETRDAYLEERAPKIRKCLEDNGIATDPDATPRELIQQALEASADTANATNCMR